LPLYTGAPPSSSYPFFPDFNKKHCWWKEGLPVPRDLFPEFQNTGHDGGFALYCFCSGVFFWSDLPLRFPWFSPWLGVRSPRCFLELAPWDPGARNGPSTFCLCYDSWPLSGVPLQRSQPKSFSPNQVVDGVQLGSALGGSLSFPPFSKNPSSFHAFLSVGFRLG